MCLSERKFDNNMRLPNGYGSVVKMSGKRRRPYMVRKTIGWHLDETKGRQIQDFQIIGYAETRAEGLKMLAEYNQNPYDVNVAKVTFSEVYERWSKYKYCDVRLGIELLCDAPGNRVQLHAVQTAVSHFLRQHTKEIAHTHRRLQNISGLKSHTVHRFIDGLNDRRASRNLIKK